MTAAEPEAVQPEFCEAPLVQPTDLAILWEDAHLLVVNKPAGLVTQGPPSAGISMIELARTHLAQRRRHEAGTKSQGVAPVSAAHLALAKAVSAAPISEPADTTAYIGVPHRLDRAVSGVLLFCCHKKSAARLAEQFRYRQTEKIYWAIVERQPDPTAGTLIDWHYHDPADYRATIRNRYDPTVNEAILHYRTLAAVTSGWLLEVRLGTGRYHQIRAQLAYHGWPIVNDVLYGATAAVPPALAALGLIPALPQVSAGATTQRIHELTPYVALHARQLTFLHPSHYELQTVTAPLPAYWSYWCEPKSKISQGDP